MYVVCSHEWISSTCRYALLGNVSIRLVRMAVRRTSHVAATSDVGRRQTRWGDAGESGGCRRICSALNIAGVCLGRIDAGLTGRRVHLEIGADILLGWRRAGARRSEPFGEKNRARWREGRAGERCRTYMGVLNRSSLDKCAIEVPMRCRSAVRDEYGRMEEGVLG